MAFFFFILKVNKLSLKNAWLLQFSFWILKTLAKTLEFVGTFFKKLEVLGTSHDAQNVCAVAKERHRP